MKKLKQRDVWIEVQWSNCNFYLKSPQVPWNWKFGFDKSSPCSLFPLGSLKPFWFSGVANDYHRKPRLIIVAFLSAPTKVATTIFLFLHFTVFGNTSKYCNLHGHWARMYHCAWNTGCCSVAQSCSTLRLHGIQVALSSSCKGDSHSTQRMVPRARVLQACVSSLPLTDD